jgi:hypothetical protein
MMAALTVNIKQPHYDHGCDLCDPDLVKLITMMTEAGSAT